MRVCCHSSSRSPVRVFAVSSSTARHLFAPPPHPHPRGQISLILMSRDRRPSPWGCSAGGREAHVSMGSINVWMRVRGCVFVQRPRTCVCVTLGQSKRHWRQTARRAGGDRESAWVSARSQKQGGPALIVPSQGDYILGTRRPRLPGVICVSGARLPICHMPRPRCGHRETPLLMHKEKLINLKWK